MSEREVGEHVSGPTVQLAAQVKALLESSPKDLIVETSYGNFYVSAVELTYHSHGDSERLGWLLPDEGDGSTFDFWTPKRGAA